MGTLCFELLRTPRMSVGGQPLTGFTTMKAQALLIYLAVTQHALCAGQRRRTARYPSTPPGARAAGDCPHGPRQ